MLAPFILIIFCFNAFDYTLIFYFYFITFYQQQLNTLHVTTCGLAKIRHIFLAIFTKKNCKNCVCLSAASYAVFVVFILNCCVKNFQSHLLQIRTLSLFNKEKSVYHSKKGLN
jgi:hypothetical protein